MSIQDLRTYMEESVLDKPKTQEESQIARNNTAKEAVKKRYNKMYKRWIE